MAVPMKEVSEDECQGEIVTTLTSVETWMDWSITKDEKEEEEEEEKEDEAPKIDRHRRGIVAYLPPHPLRNIDGGAKDGNLVSHVRARGGPVRNLVFTRATWLRSTTRIGYPTTTTRRSSSMSQRERKTKTTQTEDQELWWHTSSS